MPLAAQNQTRVIADIQFSLEKIWPSLQRNAFLHSVAASVFLGNLIEELYGGRTMSASAKRTQTGGERCLVRHEFGTSPNTRNMASGWATHGTTPSDIIRQSEATWKHYSDAITVSDTELLVNQGDSAVAAVVDTRARNAMSSLVDMVTRHIYSGNVASSLVGLDSIISNNDSVQGVSGATYLPWNSWGLGARDVAGNSFAGGSFAVNGVANWRIAYNRATHGVFKPNLLLTTEAIGEFYEGSMVPQERYTAPARTGDSGFTNFAFKMAPVFPDPLATSGVTYFINTDAVQMTVLAGADFTRKPFKQALEQEAQTSEIQFKAALVCLDRRMLNKVTTQVA